MEPAWVLVRPLPATVTLALLRTVVAQIGPVVEVKVFRRLVRGERVGAVRFADAAAAPWAVERYDRKLRCPPSPELLFLSIPTKTVFSEQTVTPEVYVSGLPTPCPPVLLYKDFAQFGQPHEVRVYGSCAVVQFLDFASSEKAIAFFSDHLLHVRYADGDLDLRVVEHGISYPLPVQAPDMPVQPQPSRPVDTHCARTGRGPADPAPRAATPPVRRPLPGRPPAPPPPRQSTPAPLPPRPLSTPPTPATPSLFVSGPPLYCMAEMLHGAFSRFGCVEEVRAKGGNAVIRFADFSACDRAFAALQGQTLMGVRYSHGHCDEATLRNGDVFRTQTEGASTSSPSKSTCSQPSPQQDPDGVDQTDTTLYKVSLNTSLPPAPRSPDPEWLRRESAEMQRQLERREAKGPQRKRQRESSDASSSPTLLPSVKQEPPEVSISDALNVSTVLGVAPEKALPTTPQPTHSFPPPPALQTPLNQPEIPQQFSPEFSTIETAQWLSWQLPSVSSFQFAHSCGKHHIDGAVLTLACHMASEGSQQEWEAVSQALRVDSPEQRQLLQSKVALSQPSVPAVLFSRQLNTRLQWSEQQVADWFATLGLSADYRALLARDGVDGTVLFGGRKNLTLLHEVLKDALRLPLGDSIKIIFAVSHASNPSAS